MAIQVTGNLELPFTDPSSKTQVRFTTSSGLGAVLRASPSTVTTGSDGAYDFMLNNGMFIIEVLYSKQWNYLGNVNVTDATQTPTTIQYLLDNSSVPLPLDGDNLPDYRTLNMRGDWSAASGLFPADPMYPTQLSDVWRISEEGTVDNGTYAIELIVDDILWWSIVNQRWFKWGGHDTDSPINVNRIQLAENQIIHGNSQGVAEATTMHNLLNSQIQIHTFDGTSSTANVVHNKNRKVFPIMFNHEHVIVHPTFETIDENTLEVTSVIPLQGVLLII